MTILELRCKQVAITDTCVEITLETGQLVTYQYAKPQARSSRGKTLTSGVPQWSASPTDREDYKKESVKPRPELALGGGEPA